MTELESCVLGIVWQLGPITAYEIARPFAESPSAYWSGSAGAIYPLVKRLERQKLIAGETAKWNSRKKRLFRLTAAGLSALREWLAPPFPESAGAASFDPIRTRLVFLDALPPHERARFVDDAERVVREQLRVLEERHRIEEAEEKTLDALATRGGIHELRARLRWLGEVRARLAT
jgi:DNA-binding PadR family transcriptional regulator